MPGDEQSGGNTRGMKDTEEWISRGIKEESYSLAKSNNIANMQCHINSLLYLGYRKGKATKNATKKHHPLEGNFFSSSTSLKYTNIFYINLLSRKFQRKKLSCTLLHYLRARLSSTRLSANKYAIRFMGSTPPFLGSWHRTTSNSNQNYRVED
jgi:hypothetical protein